MHPSILKAPSQNHYTLNSISLAHNHNFTPAPSVKGYLSQAVLFGPDAAVELRKNKIKLFLDGSATENPAFKDFIDSQETALWTRARELTSDPSDVAIFIGKWYHVEYDMEPIFRPYLIRVVHHDGSIRIVPQRVCLLVGRGTRVFRMDWIASDELVTDPRAFFNANPRRLFVLYRWPIQKAAMGPLEAYYGNRETCQG